MRDHVLLYVTTANANEAKLIARTLLNERLVACANIDSSITSLYRWKGDVQEDSEARLILKTRQPLTNRTVARIKELHSYDCPCILALPIEGGNEAFMRWIDAETR